MRIGIIGLPASGKTTLFNALTRGRAATGFAAGRGANVGVAHVPDHRLDALTELYKPQRTVPAEVTYVDLPGPSDYDGPKGGMFAGVETTISGVNGRVTAVGTGASGAGVQRSA